MLGQRHDVAGAVGQRRQRQFHRVEPVVEVFAERTLADHCRQVGIGRTDHAHLDLAFAVGTQALEASCLQHAQQLHLPTQRQVADFIQEQRAAVGRLELAFARLVGAGVGAGLGTEQFGLDQLGGQGAAVHRHEGALGHQRVGLDDLRDLLLARAIGAGDQHRQLRARDLAGQGDHPLAGGVGEHRAAQRVLVFQCMALALFALASLVQFAPRFGQFQQVVDRGQQLAVIPGFGQVVGGTGLDQVHRAAQVGPGRQQDYRQIGVAFADLREQRLAFLAGGGVLAEVHVLDHQVDRL
ncbi:hypothetical protein D3C72_1416520 [compost metagenome]